MKLKEKLKNLFGKTKGQSHWFIGNRRFFNYVILRKDNYEWLEEVFEMNFEIHSQMRNFVNSEYKIEKDEQGAFLSIFREEEDCFGRISRIYVIRILKHCLSDKSIAKAEQIVKLLNDIRHKREDIPDMFEK